LRKIKAFIDLPNNIKGFANILSFIALALAVISAFYPLMILAISSFILAIYARCMISKEEDKDFRTANSALIISGISILFYILTILGVIKF
jgi:hypothetical protein